MGEDRERRRCRQRLTSKTLERARRNPLQRQDGTRKIRQKLSRSIEIDDQIAATSWYSTSKNWRSSQIPRLGINISLRIYVFFVLVNSNMAKFLAKRRWNQEEIPILRRSSIGHVRRACLQNLKLLLFLQKWWQRTNNLGPMRTCKEICRKITSKKSANLPYHLQLTKPCCNVGIAKTVARGQYFTTLDDAELDSLGGHVESILLLEATHYPKWKEREWIDVEPGLFDKNWFEVSWKMIRLPRRDSSLPREEDGAVEFRILAQMFHSEYTSSQDWWILTWLNYLQNGGGPKKRFQYCVDPHSADTILYLRAQFKAILEVNTLILHCKTTCCYRTTSPSTSITLEAPMTYTPSSSLDWFRVGKMSRKGMRCSSHESDVRWSARWSRVRRDEAQNCSVRNIWKVHKK